MMKNKVAYIDPPEGWKYGFPKPVPYPRPANMLEWLVENGYPQKIIDIYGEYFYCRHWERDEESDENTTN
jgi:hypothetical protein